MLLGDIFSIYESKEELTKDDNIKDAIVAFLNANPRPSDDDVHELAMSLNIDAKKIEEIMYELLSSMLTLVDKYKDVPDSNFDEEELKKGIAVELEHTKSEYLAKIIAKAHLDEFPDYYKALVKMKDDIKKDEE